MILIGNPGSLPGIVLGRRLRMERVCIRVRKTLWLTLSAVPGYEKTALAMLMGHLACDRQSAHMLKILG